MEESGADRSPLLRQKAAQILYDVYEKQAYTAIALDRELRRSAELSQPQRNLVTEMVNGTVRMTRHLDGVLDLFLQKNITAQPPWLRIVLRLAAYQLLFMEQAAPEVAVDSAVRIARRRLGDRMAGVCNGVLRNLLRQRDGLPGQEEAGLAVYYSQPDWIVEHLRHELSEAQLLTALTYYNKRAVTALRCNALRGTREELLAALAEQGAKADASAWTPWAVRLRNSPVSLNELEALAAGRCYVQNESSMLAAAILAPQPGELVYDFCCGLGGKSCHFAEWMGDGGEIGAFDLYPHKIELLEQNARRLGIESVRGEVRDLLTGELPARPADRIFVDAPCSGLGVLNRRSDLRWRMRREEIAALAEMQARLLRRAAAVLKPGGVLVYATCTVNREENRRQIERFLDERPDFALYPFAGELTAVGLDAEDKAAAGQGMLGILPGAYDTDGMFYARLRKD
ncbi:MAG: 16S rRNA (cytosine(967)-C(5))-methyltransferase RsmB [Syntrophomonadaceae bacterium]|nr:16S rRNA (cytosine(967)-C(5))-methyltransferase RsmB [Syntrophomonadaceae bacterium]